MAIPHAKPAKVIDIRPLGTELQDAQTTTLIKTDSLEVIRLVLPVGKDIKRHSVPGEITVQCLEGKVVLSAGESECQLTTGQLLYLPGSGKHALRAVEDSSLLVTILLEHKQPRA
jgi:quercetin dioxygenase-like cupin family protein